MEDIYPAGPVIVPDNFTNPTPAYKRHAWLAVAGLGSFVVAYMALTVWFTWTAYRLLSGIFNFEAVVVGLFAGLLAVFMLKALFFVKHRYEINDIEITAEQHPRLFKFLHRLADEAKAPRPHRVFLSPRVNAAVSYDLSIINLIFPSKKNLEIGLGLVNALKLGELKAVLAHEFGHFAQRSMAVGRWVYIAQQIAGHIIARRDALDTFLRKLSRFNIRIAWVGWVLTLIIWSIRSVMETLFRIVILTQRALAREMEFQADLVAVSLTGSDALIHALHRLQAADRSWERAVNFAISEAQEGRKVRDIFAIQNRVTEHLRIVFGQPDYGEVPALPAHQPEAHRLFKKELAQAPQMWSTHPTNPDRENNAKRTYIPAPVDERSAWEIFDDAQGLRERMSAHMIEAKEAQVVPIEESLQKLDEQYSLPFLNPRYRGAYLSRSPVRHAAAPSLLYDSKLDSHAVVAALDELYSESLAHDLERLRNLEADKAALEALQRGVMDAPGGVIRHRGRELKRRDLPQAIEELSAEIAAVNGVLQDHDRRCRTAHLLAAAGAGAGWEEYLTGLAAVLHYADHSEANLRDAQLHLGNVFAVVTADGRVSRRELDRLIPAANEVHQALNSIYRQAGSVALDPALAQCLGAETWKQCLGEFNLPRADSDNISEWLKVVDSWVNAAAATLFALRQCALERLLISESNVARFAREGIQLGQAPPASSVPSNYFVLTPGSERALQTKLDWWARFQVADGLFATVARLAVATAIVVAALMVGGSIGESQITIYNGLARRVRVQIADIPIQLPPFGKTSLSLKRSEPFIVRTQTLQGQEIESFEETLSGNFDHYMYNVAGASPMMLWTAVYGNARATPERLLGAPRWSTTTATVLFEQPPENLSTQNGGTTREVVSGFGDARPARALSFLNQDADSRGLIAAHARWDDLESRHILDWLTLARRNDGFAAVLETRLKESPGNPLLLRVEQDAARTDLEREKTCARHQSLAAASANNPDMQYVVDRCIQDAAKRNEAFIAHYRAAPENGWLAFAAGYTFAEEDRWQEAIQALEITHQKLAPMAEFAASDLARIRRLTQGVEANIKDLLDDSDSLSQLLALESGQDVAGSALAYRALAQGALDEALRLARGAQAMETRIIRFAAASDGATGEMVQRALQLKVEEDLDEQVAWAMLGLAARERVDITQYITAVTGSSAAFTTESLRRLVNAAGRDSAAFDKMLQHSHPVIRAHAYVLGVVVRGTDSPLNWRESAKRLLFSPERPYFK